MWWKYRDEQKSKVKRENLKVESVSLYGVRFSR